MFVALAIYPIRKYSFYTLSKTSLLSPTSLRISCKIYIEMATVYNTKLPPLFRNDVLSTPR